MSVVELMCNDVSTVKLKAADVVYNREFNIRSISGSECYNDIFEKFILKNVPFTMRIESDWKCLQKWVISGKPDFQFLINKFGSAVVPVANCGVKYFNAQEKENMLLRDFLEYWKDYIDNEYCSNMKCLYLKDWHFTKDYPSANVYTVPKYFCSDWLNEYLSSKSIDNVDQECMIRDDYRFVYMGPKGTWTPLHADVFSSFSWSANICGKKKWRLFPPGEESHLKDRFGNLVYDIESKDLENSNLFPDYTDSLQYYELIQGPGEAIFVPSGWHHQVWNLDDTISINHNWVNGCNINLMWLSLQQNLMLVKKEIADCQDMDGWIDHCQLMLKASFGIDYSEFYEFVRFIADKRISLVNYKKPLIMYGNWELGLRHASFDLIKINGLLYDLISNDDFKSLKYFVENFDDIRLFCEKISNTVTKIEK